jgi:hypothetical protein
MKLNVIERVTLMRILPNEGNFVTWKIILNLKSSLSFTEKEYKAAGMYEKEGMTYWTKSIDKEIEIGEKANDVIVSALKGLDNAGKLTEVMLSLYEKFIETVKT